MQIYNLCIAYSVFLVLAAGCGLLNKRLGLPDDHLVEEVTEAILEDKLNVKIDLTPETEEVKNAI